MNAQKIIDITQVRPGDVLLCQYEMASKGKTAFKDKSPLIAQATGSNYTHAVICCSKGQVAESGGGLVSRIPISEIVDASKYVAVFRAVPGVWSENRVAKMNEFVDRVISLGARYNLSGAIAYLGRKGDQDVVSMQQLDEYFKGKFVPDNNAKDAYFCSELVVACFIASGYMEPSAQVYYKPDLFSPKDLAGDASFGSFVGYVTPNAETTVPEDDEFYNRPTYGETFGNQ